MTADGGRTKDPEVRNVHALYYSTKCADTGEQPAKSAVVSQEKSENSLFVNNSAGRYRILSENTTYTAVLGKE